MKALAFHLYTPDAMGQPDDRSLSRNNVESTKSTRFWSQTWNPMPVLILNLGLVALYFSELQVSSIVNEENKTSLQGCSEDKRTYVELQAVMTEKGRQERKPSW